MEYVWKQKPKTSLKSIETLAGEINVNQTLANILINRGVESFEQASSLNIVLHQFLFAEFTFADGHVWFCGPLRVAALRGLRVPQQDHQGHVHA
jgi:hypothetical protein